MDASEVIESQLLDEDQEGIKSQYNGLEAVTYIKLEKLHYGGIYCVPDGTFSFKLYTNRNCTIYKGEEELKGLFTEEAYDVRLIVSENEEYLFKRQDGDLVFVESKGNCVEIDKGALFRVK